MVTLTNWYIKNDIFEAKVVLSHTPDKVIRASYNTKTKKFKVYEKISEADAAEIKKALIRVYVKYKRGQAKPGTIQVVAWG